jgi:tetratricopeptide (TPR) repeat protein
MELPMGLLHAIETSNCVLFIGAGVGCHLFDSTGKSAPNGSQLARELIDHFHLGTDSDDLAKVSQLVEIRKGRTELETFLKKRLANLEPDESLQWLFTQRWKALYTTNYDSSIIRGYEMVSNPKQNPVPFHLTSNVRPYDERFEIPVYYLHGMLYGTEDPKIIVTESDYSVFRERRRMLFELLKKEFVTSNILYVGYSNRDGNWRLIYDEIAAEYFPSQMPRSYRIDPFSDPTDVEILKSKNIETLPCSYDEFRIAADAALKGSKDTTYDRLEALKKNVPPQLLDVFDKNPAPVARLLTSWMYVDLVPFHETPNLHEFLLGDRPNWGLVGARHFFERDIEEEVYDELIDYATSESSKVHSIIVLAPAGYGVTTLLMAVSSRLIKERAGHVFFLKPGMPLLEGDIEFIATHFDGKLFFIVDNAADSIENLSSSFSILKERKKSVMFLMGERTNEWRQGLGRIYPKEFAIDPLSDPEINRLLDFLTDHVSLHSLAHLPRDLQFTTIKVRHGKELLVAMREATEGRNFDAIIEDEYRGITNSICRYAYLIVSAFYLHGVYLRTSLLADLLKISLEDLHADNLPKIEGVVNVECIDVYKGLYATRCRHRVIASIVWERCATIGEKELIIQSSLSSLNLNYKHDCMAFESFVRDDRTVDSITSLDGKIRFFETACKKDPQSPYIRQHYARMLSREDKNELALNQIDEAIKLDSSVRVLYHTKAIVLKQLAINSESLDIGRRRLIQSETNFRKCINIYQKDEYSYQGLAQLFIEWARKVHGTEETAVYISKAEEVINEGLKVVRIRDGLWIESARIQQILGNEPSQLRALETAVLLTPGSIIARYLLGRAYRKSNRYSDAIRILDPVIKNHHEEFRAFVEYATCLLQERHSYSEIAQTLRLSSLYGMSDPRYLAMLGGMLYLSKEFSEAKKVFEESLRQNFTANEINTIQFIPPDPDNLLKEYQLPGTVVTVKPGYSMIESHEFPTILCPGSKYGGLNMEKGLKVVFTIGFCAKGPIALRPQLTI